MRATGKEWTYATTHRTTLRPSTDPLRKETESREATHQVLLESPHNAPPSGAAASKRAFKRRIPWNRRQTGDSDHGIRTTGIGLFRTWNSRPLDGVSLAFRDNTACSSSADAASPSGTSRTCRMSRPCSEDRSQIQATRRKLGTRRSRIRRVSAS